MESLARSSDWCYRSEGNRNVVIYSKQYGRVYRVLKVDTAQTAGTGVSNDSIHAHYNKQIQYNACVMDRLYLDYMSVPVMKYINVQFLAKLAKDIETQRPDKRVSKSISLCPTVLDIPDYAFLPSAYRDRSIPSFMFELKAGAVARTYNNLLSYKYDSHPTPHCDLSKSYCYYCISKSLSPKNDKKRLSRYCPQELFSGNQKRMTKCLTQLFEDINCSRNKLRIFEDGTDITSSMHGADDVRCYFSRHLPMGDNSDMLSMLAHLLISCLTHSKRSIKRKGSVPLMTYAERRDDSDLPTLPTGCVLSTFINAQCFGVGNLEEIQVAYDKLQYRIAHDSDVRSKLCIDGPYDTGLWRLGSRPTLPQGISHDIMTDFITVRNYLIYRTAKDASILVTFQPVNGRAPPPADEAPNESVFVVSDPTGSQTFNCHVTIIDLDPKPFSRMDRYLSSEWKVYNALRNQQSM